MAVNDQYRGEFMPGISAGVPNLAPGSPGASGDAADDDGAGRVTPPWGPSQDSARYPASTSGTVLPGQVDVSDISPGPQAGYVDTNAGRGNPSPYRHPNGG